MNIISVKSKILMKKKIIAIKWAERELLVKTDGKCNRSPDETTQQWFEMSPLLMLDKIKVKNL